MSPFGYPHREDEKLQRQVGGEQQRKSRENLPPHPLSRPVLRFHRRSRSGSGTARFRKRRLGSRGRIYSMLAEEMGSSTNRGRVIWILASSRPDLIEVDLKRPGRVDVKIPLFPTTTAQESFNMIRMLCQKRGVLLQETDFAAIQPQIPLLLTPGAAETLAVKIYRQVRTEQTTPLDAVRACLTDYQNPVPLETLEFQIRLAVTEASDLEFVPQSFRTRVASIIK